LIAGGFSPPEASRTSPESGPGRHSSAIHIGLAEKLKKNKASIIKVVISPSKIVIEPSKVEISQ
jgi:hypothetical protein